MPSFYDYQIDAIRKMKNGSILAGGVGSGKSRTAIGYFCTTQGAIITGNKIGHMKKKPKNLYIITTARKRDTYEWDGELTNFNISTKKGDHNFYDIDIVIDSWNNIEKYVKARDAFFIFDEQRLVGYGKWVKCFLRIVKNNDWILLSATPGDKWEDYIPVFIANGFYRNKTDFCQQHVVWSRFTDFPKIDRFVNTRRLTRLRDSILVDMDFERPTTSHHSDIYVEYDMKLYKDIFKKRWNFEKDEPIETASELCYMLRKVSNTHQSRLDTTAKILKEKKKLIIFYNFDYELEMLRDLCDSLDICYAEWNGHKHQEIPDENEWAYLVQYTAGCEGWNCIVTDTILFFSQNYSYKVLVQAAGRIDRLNTPFRDLYYYHLKSHSSIDIAITKAIHSKKKFNESRFVKI